ncbi:hypothetical protein J6590_015300 [Homalodisca vitripennis]|nr:hypothetical protein J6590_015300 [Homalodisca vitripennis]
MENTAKYKIIESEKVSALWCNGTTFTRQVRDSGSTPGGANALHSTRRLPLSLQTNRDRLGNLSPLTSLTAGESLLPTAIQQNDYNYGTH